MSMHRGTPKSGPWLLSASEHEASHDDPSVWGEEGFSPREDDKQDQEITAGLHDWNDSVPEDEARIRLRQTLDDQGTPFTPDGMTHALQEYQRMRDDYHRHGARTPKERDQGAWQSERAEYEDEIRRRHPVSISDEEADEYMKWLDNEPYMQNRQSNFHSGQPKSGPWLLEASRHEAAGNKDFHQHDWRTAKDYGHFHSNSRPPLLSDIPHPSELNLRGKGGAAIAARAAASQDPDRDPYGVLNGSGKTFDDLVHHAKEHYYNASPQQKEEGRLWYPGYSNLIQHVSDRTIKDPDKASAIFSAHSPRQNFDTNVEQGAHFLFNYDGSDPNFKASPMSMHTGKAKQIWHSPSADHDAYQQILNGPKTKSFHVNGDPRNHNLRPAREGHEDDWGYHEMPINPHTGEPDFRMHPDQQATIDTHQARAMSAPHGADLSDLRYATPADFEYEFTSNKKDINPGYDLYNRALQEATRQINAENPDAHQQIVPNQTQAVDWTKFKKDVDDAGRGADLVDPGLMPKGLQRALDRGKSEEEWAQNNPLKNPFPRYQIGDDTWVDPRRQPVPDDRRLPTFRDVLHKLKAGSVSHDGSFWGDFLGAFIEEHKASYDEPSSLEEHEQQRMGPNPQHEAAIQPNWYKAPEGTPSPINSKPRLKPRRPQAPRVEHNPRRASWYIDAADKHVQEYGGGDGLPVQPWFQPDYAFDEFGDETPDYAVQRDHAEFPGEYNPGFRPRFVDMQGKELKGPPEYTPSWEKYQPDTDLSQRTSSWYLTADDSPAPGSDQQRATENPAGHTPGAPGSQGAAMSGGDSDPHAYPMTPVSYPSSGGGGYSGGGSSGGAYSGPGTPAGPGAVPITVNPDGTISSPNPDWEHLINRESGGRNVGQGITDSNGGPGSPNAAQGYFQITPATWHSHGGDQFAPNPLAASPQQQAEVAGNIFRSNPSGSDWGAGLSGRENASGLASGLGPAPGVPGVK